ncbi:hypothetical protein CAUPRSCDRAFT_12590, partial [Caulochytrium protostelioides]
TPRTLLRRVFPDASPAAESAVVDEETVVENDVLVETVDVAETSANDLAAEEAVVDETAEAVQAVVTVTTTHVAAKTVTPIRRSAHLEASPPALSPVPVTAIALAPEAALAPSASWPSSPLAESLLDTDEAAKKDTAVFHDEAMESDAQDADLEIIPDAVMPLTPGRLLRHVFPAESPGPAIASLPRSSDPEEAQAPADDRPKVAEDHETLADDRSEVPEIPKIPEIHEASLEWPSVSGTNSGTVVVSAAALISEIDEIERESVYDVTTSDVAREASLIPMETDAAVPSTAEATPVSPAERAMQETNAPAATDPTAEVEDTLASGSDEPLPTPRP